MRTRAQIGKLLYDSLSNATWTRLREAFLGQELIAVGTEIIYKYEILAHASPWTPTPPSGTDNDYRNRYRTLVTTYLSDPQRGWDVTTDVSKAVIDWATEVLYQAYLAVKKNKEDEVVDTASYVGLIEDSLKLTNPVPVSQCKPATLTVMLPVGNEVYPPYSVSISCGAAQFWNVKTYRSGEQATLYQGIPYYYGVDVSGLSEATYYDSTLQYVEKGTSTDRYVKLSSTALPESVQVYAVSKTYRCFTPRLQSGPAFKVLTSRDGSIETHFSDGNWSTMSSGDENFCPGAEDWCIRFLDLTDTEFDTNTATIPEGYTLLSSEQANFTDIDYARRYFYKWQYMFNGQVGASFSNLTYFITSIPNIQEVSVITSKGIIYVKPVKDSENLIFDEVESFLNTYYDPGDSVISTLLVFCGYPREYTIQITINTPSAFSTELRARITEYLKKTYSYEKITFFDEVLSNDVHEEICTEFGLEGNEFSVNFIVSQGVYRSTIKFNNSFVRDTAQMNRDDTVTAYSEDKKMYQLALSSTGKTMDLPSTTLAVCWGWQFGNSTGDSSCYNLKSREFANGGMPFAQLSNANFYDGFGLKAVSSPVLNPTDLKVISTNYDSNTQHLQNYFLNPRSQVSWDDLNVFIGDPEHPLTSELIEELLVGLNGTPFTFPSAVDSASFYSVITQSSGYKIARYSTGGTDPGAILPLPSKPTYASYYNGDVYISCESAQIAIVKRLTDYITGGAAWSIDNDFFVYGVYDSTSTAIPAVDLLPWSFNQLSPVWHATGGANLRAPDFYACVGLDGGMSILTLDAEDPGTSIPALISASGSRAIAKFEEASDARKKQINSKWHFYTADRFKITAKGIQTINMREIATMPTLASCNEAPEGSGATWLALRSGYWKFSGRAIYNGFGVTSAYQTYIGWSGEDPVYSLLNTAYYDLLNNISSYSESASYSSEAPTERGCIESYTATEVGTAEHDDGIVTLNGGSYAHNTISVVASGSVQSSPSNTPDCYIELSDEIVKWI